jgi:pimeloyl-ACP methyl ester carboxylesterase
VSPVAAKTRYARAGDLSIAYQVVGDGPLDLVWVPGFISNVEIGWEHPLTRRFLERLSSFSRLITFDKRGTGLSDRLPLSQLPTLEERMDDVRAVMDAVGSERAALFGISEGGPMAILFAATYPDRAQALILYGCFARGSGTDDYPHLPPPSAFEPLLEQIERDWADGPALSFWAPDLVGDAGFEEFWGRLLRSAATPAVGVGLLRLAGEIDVRGILPTIDVPTLVVHRSDDILVPLANGRYLAEHIPHARLVELPGRDHFWAAGDQDAVVDEIEEFLTGQRHEREPERVLATVLFTDIVGSTERAAEMGDSRWRSLLGDHNRLVRRHLERHRGREVKTVGDGFVATFDGPGRGIRCAQAIAEDVERLGIEIRAGLHTGECEIVGDDVAGVAVHIGARVGARAAPGEVLVSSTVKDLVAGSGIEFEDRGAQSLKGVPGEWRLYAAHADGQRAGR